MAGRRLSLEQRVRCVRLFSRTGNVSEVQRRMLEEFGPPAVHRNTISQINEMFDRTGSANHPKNPGPSRSVRTDDMKNRLRAELESSPNKSKSSRRLSAKLKIGKTSVLRMLHEIKHTPYHPRRLHALNEDDFDRRIEFSEAWSEVGAAMPSRGRKRKVQVNKGVPSADGVQETKKSKVASGDLRLVIEHCNS
uniref:DUF4817 domain-containing protein n=1 Tax=Erpetoichthys calabaricus TaxID=27687 RepID=A0A8C4SCJ4_ERPCA